MSNIFSTVTTCTVFSQSLLSEAVRLNTAKLKTWPSAEVSALNTHNVTGSDLFKKRKGNLGRVKKRFGWTPLSDVWAFHFSPPLVEGMYHKSAALSKYFSKETIYRSLSDVELGLCHSQILLVHEAELDLPCSFPFAIRCWTGKDTFPDETYLKVFCVILWEVDLGCVHPTAGKGGGKLFTSVFSYGKCVLVFPGPAFTVALAPLGTALWIIPAGRAIILCQIRSLSSQLSFILCQFLPLCVIYPADFSFTPCCPLRLLY